MSSHESPFSIAVLVDKLWHLLAGCVAQIDGSWRSPYLGVWHPAGDLGWSLSWSWRSPSVEVCILGRNSASKWWWIYLQKICSIAFLCRNCQSRAQLENYKFVFGHFGRHSAVIFDDNLSHCTTQGPSSPGTSQNLFHATPTLNWETRAIFSVMS